MKKFWNVLKLIGILVCIVFILWLLLFDIIDRIVPGNFPNWVYVIDLAATALFIVLALADFIKKCCQRHKAKMNRKQD